TLRTIAGHAALALICTGCVSTRDSTIRQPPAPRAPSSVEPGATTSAPAPVPVVGRVVDRIHVGGQPQGELWADGSIWVADFGGDSVDRIDPRAGRLVASIRVGDAPRAMSGEANAIWVANYRGDSVSKIDPRT